MDSIEPAFTPLISICTELSTSAGYLDNLWMTPSGGIVLGECKLLRNPQSRREVVVQALDYARAINEWSYEDLEREVGRARGEAGIRLWDLVDHDARLEEALFHDAVERRLELGRFLCLVIADGIQEGAESLARYLQLHAGLHVGLALIDLSIWDLGDGNWVIAPRVPLKTSIVERGVVTMPHAAGVRIEESVRPPPARVKSAAVDVRPTSLSEAEFLDALDVQVPGSRSGVASLVASLFGLGLDVQFGTSAKIYLRMVKGLVNLGTIDTAGRVWFDHGSTQALRLGIGEPFLAYLDAVAVLGRGSVKRHASGGLSIVGADGKGSLSIATLLKGSDAWLAVIERLIVEARRVDERSDVGQ